MVIGTRRPRLRAVTAIVGDGDIYVDDVGNQRIQKFAP